MTISPSIIFVLFMTITTIANAESTIRVFAAASLTDVMTQLVNQYKQVAPTEVRTSFAASSALAKQIEQGAPADILMTADTQWMHYVQHKQLIQSNTQRTLLGNTLVLIAPKGKRFSVTMKKGFALDKAFSGKLCTGETTAVPVGIYAKQSLQALGWWSDIQPRIVGTQDVRSALVLVERGECDAGIVYATDAKISHKVEVVATFPANSHAPVEYPLALVKGANADALAFYRFLTSNQAAMVFKDYGFTVLDPAER